MNKKVLALLTALALLVMWYVVGLRSCNSTDIVFEPGFELFRSPRSSYGLGTIYRVDSVGRVTIVSDTLAKLLEAFSEVRRDAEELPRFARDGRFRIDMGSLAGFLGSAAGTARFSDTLGLRFSLAGAEREWIPDENFDQRLEEYQRGRFNALALDPDVVITVGKIRPGNRYFVIRETIRADSVDWQFERGSLAQVGVSGSIAEWLELKDAVAETKGGQTITLSQRFRERMRVFYRGDGIRILSSGDSAQWLRDPSASAMHVVRAAPFAPQPPNTVLGDVVTTSIVASMDTSIRSVRVDTVVEWRIQAVRRIPNGALQVDLGSRLPTDADRRSVRLASVDWRRDARVEPAGSMVRLNLRESARVRSTVGTPVQLTFAMNRRDTTRVAVADTVRGTQALIAGQSFTIVRSSGETASVKLRLGTTEVEFDPAEVIENDYVVRISRTRRDDGSIAYLFRVKAS